MKELCEVSETFDETPEVVVRERTRTRVVIEEEIDEPELDHSKQKLIVESEKIPETMYAKSGNVNIAYQVVGDAPLDLVFMMGWVSHLEYFWKEPSFARFLRRVSSFARLILSTNANRSF